ncbi:M15 family metallopeptidase [Candidatus Saccharibacteria bacterium]|nr:M15 family metallopeptidase [Candidatus Saccharibacteria bacterium]
MSKTKILLPVIIIALIIVGFFYYFGYRKNQTNTNSTSQLDSNNINESETNPPTGFDKTKYSIDEPGSIWWIVNKNRPLPDGYVPSDLIVPDVKLRLGSNAEQMQFSKTAEPALIEMFKAATTDGITLVFGSGYRSYDLQKQFYDSYVAQDGQEAADRYSARPGTSEHQTGLSFDATSVGENCHLEICWENTPEGQWVKNNSYKYGFVVRYPNGKESITGYQYEPWHLRYVGVELATELQTTGQTMEEFFGIN